MKAKSIKNRITIISDIKLLTVTVIFRHTSCYSTNNEHLMGLSMPVCHIFLMGVGNLHD